jgi:hypothetical protein
MSFYKNFSGFTASELILNKNRPDGSMREHLRGRRPKNPDNGVIKAVRISVYYNYFSGGF